MSTDLLQPNSSTVSLDNGFELIISFSGRFFPAKLAYKLLRARRVRGYGSYWKQHRRACSPATVTMLTETRECRHIRPDLNPDNAGISNPAGRIHVSARGVEQWFLTLQTPRSRQMVFSDIPKVVELQRRVFPGMAIWKPEELAHHLAVFPEGQLVAADARGEILSSASSLIIDRDDYLEDAKWSTITGEGSFDTHNRLGKTLYGADMGVDPCARRLGIGSRFYETANMKYRKCGSQKLKTFSTEMGLAITEHQSVCALCEPSICVDCGFAEGVLPEVTLKKLRTEPTGRLLGPDRKPDSSP